MSWPYRFVDLTDAQKEERRFLLDRYGTYAHLSAFIPVIIYNIYRLATWVYSQRQRSNEAYSAVPSSPTLKKRRTTWRAAWGRKWRNTLWWLQGGVGRGWGERGHWIGAGLWASWLGYLCVHKTGDDYLHVTKRFGIIAASQFPLHYALSLKSLYSPLAILSGASHEQLNTWHRILGRIIWTLLLLHATFYLNFFVLAGVLSKRLSSPVVIYGIASFQLINILIITSLAAVRRWSYRVFFVTHLFVLLTVIPLLFFHAPPIRLYMVEALALFIVDLVIRKLNTTTTFTTISAIPETSLLKLTLPIPASKISQFQKAPGQHVYLSIPSISIPTTSKTSPYLHEFLFNPFTISSVSTSPSPHITLTLRTLDGPTTSALLSLSRLTKARPPLNIEGPYGTSRRFPNFAEQFDRVLLIAGGVGATFILPIYRATKEAMENEEHGKGPRNVRMIWSMRDVAEASWALSMASTTSDDNGEEASSSADESGDEEAKGNVQSEDEDIELFITKSTHAERERTAPESSQVELQTMHSVPSTKRTYARPDLQKIVDETFAHGVEEKVAVLVCGPNGMGPSVREYVGKWVEKGRHVWWHDESFGW
ncbi:ferric reductase like transmembrane component protein [Rutstroemia sp. NJR-2017a WRK4]|nr:ferric reductase like transmembrane component protein [Rutstroemia sp. NJR-2017a WRK4]